VAAARDPLPFVVISVPLCTSRRVPPATRQEKGHF
jgi:hypothetical protein